MKRKLSKKQQEQLKKNNLRYVITMVSYGVTGGDDIERDDFIFSVDHLAKLLPGLKKAFNIGDEHDYLLALWNLDKYICVEDIVEFYWNAGVRA